MMTDRQPRGVVDGAFRVLRALPEAGLESPRRSRRSSDALPWATGSIIDLSGGQSL
jgi:hypothetical protein